jgi:hypothetical protein
MSLELETSYEEEDKRDTYGARQSDTWIPEEPWDLRGGKDNLEREDVEWTL